jgi:tetratricopeptide (TPR) repeat protein
MIDRHILKRVFCAAFVGAVLSWPYAAIAQTDQETRRIMFGVFDALAYLLPYSLSQEIQQQDEASELMRQKLDALKSSVDTFLDHADQRDVQFQSLARSFARAVDQLQVVYDSQQPEDARYLLTDLIDNCTACHSRLPDLDTFHFGQRMLSRIEVDALDPLDLAEVLIATRQFDIALKALEGLVADPQVSPLDLDAEGVFYQHLLVSIRVLQDTQTAIAMLDTLLARTDLPFYLRRYAQKWREDAESLELVLSGAAELAAARTLYEQASTSDASVGREGLVRDLVASSLLHRYIEAQSTGAESSLAEAYYMLGVIALRTLEPRPAVPEMEFLFDAAIRSDPTGPYAKKAYGLLEENGFFGYPSYTEYGDSEAMIQLRALRQLIGLPAASGGG